MNQIEYYTLWFRKKCIFTICVTEMQKTIFIFDTIVEMVKIFVTVVP